MYAFIVIFIFIIIAMVVGATMYEIYLTYVQDKQGYAQARKDAQYTLLAMRARDMYIDDVSDNNVYGGADWDEHYIISRDSDGLLHVDMDI